MRSTLIKCLWAIAAFAPLLAATARADVLLDETNLVGLPSVAQPSELLSPPPMRRRSPSR